MKVKAVFPQILSGWLLAAALGLVVRPALGGSAGDYDVVWTNNSNISANSMPTGNGDIGLNVWTEDNGDLLLYIGKTDALDESSRLLKLGRLRIHYANNPFAAGQAFRQELNLTNSEIRITAGTGTGVLNLRVWVDANNPVVHVESQSATAFTQNVQLELWRTNSRALVGNEAHGVDGMTSSNSPMQYPDAVVDTSGQAGLTSQLVWYHNNELSIYPATLQVQDLNPAWCPPDPLLGRTFGCAVAAAGFVTQSPLVLATGAAVTNTHIVISPLTLQTDTNTCLAALAAQSAQAQQANLETARTNHQAWWQAFWQRSWVRLTATNTTDAADTANVSLGWHLNRYTVACNARGSLPVKFNGGIFNMDNIDQNGSTTSGLTVDARQWGPADWFQNERHVYWPMLAAGDYEQLLPFFQMYLNALPMATNRTRLYYSHDGVFFPETTYFWGGYLNRGDLGYGWDRTGKADGLTDNQYIRRYWQGALELTAMMLEYYRHTQSSQFATNTLLPLASQIITFYDQHYTRDAQGKIYFYPAQMLETYWDVVNPTPEIAGLNYCLNSLLAVPTNLVNSAQQTQWTRMLTELPALPTTTANGVTVIARGAVVNGSANNSENGNLYAIWPYLQSGVTAGNLKLAQNSYANRQFQSGSPTCWNTDPLFAAYAGLSQAATYHLASRFVLSGALRFPTFYVQGDWVPDFDNGGVCQNTIQSMLMQCNGSKIMLVPAWPANWIADFKLRAPYQTIVQGTVSNGVVFNLQVTPGARLADVVVAAFNPSPADQSVSVSPQPQLSWSAVLGNCLHDLYLGTNAAAVANAATNAPEYQGRRSAASYTPGTPLLSGTTYYWRVDEVVAGTNVATGTVWSFTTLPPPIIWNGNVNGTWDIGGTANWKSNGAAATYIDGYPVQFDDTAAGATVVSNAVTVSPVSLIVSNFAKTYTIGGAIGGSGSVTKLGGGTLALSGANSYTGLTTVQGGTLIMNKFPVTGSVSAIAGGSLAISNGAACQINYASGSISGMTALTGGGAFILAGTGTYDYEYAGGTAQYYTMSAGALFHVVSGDARGGYGYNAHWSGNQSGLTVDSGAQFDLWDVNNFGGYYFDGVNGGGTIQDTEGSNANTLTVGVAGGSGTFGGVIQNAISLVKSGSGTQILTGTNTYTGTTTVTGGTLIVEGAGRLGGGNYAGALADSGAFVYNSSAAQTLVGVISGCGTLTQAGPGKLILSSAGTFPGALTVNDGATLGVTVSGSSQLAPGTFTEGSSAGPVTNEFAGVVSTTIAPVAAGTLTVKGTTTVNIVSGSFAVGQLYPLISFTNLTGVGGFKLGTPPPGYMGRVVTNGGSIALSVTGTAALIWNGNVNGTWDIGGTANWKTNGVAVTYVDGNPVQFDDTAGGATVVSNAATVSPGGITVNNTAKNYTIGGSALGGSGGLTKAGGGTLTLTGANTYNGSTAVNAGQLFLANPFAYASATTTLAAGAMLVISNAANGNLAANTAYAGAGVLQKTGAGMVGNGNQAVHFYLATNGVFDVQAGDFNLGGLQAELLNNAGSLNVAAGATFHISDPAWQADGLTGGGKINNAYDNTTPTLTLGVAGTANNATYGVTNNTAVFSGVIGYAETYNTVSVGTMNLIKTGAGTQVLAGASGYTGTTTISNGTLLVNGSLAAGSAVTVVAAGTLGGTGTVGGAVTVAGTLAPGPGVATLNTGAETWNGGGSYACNLSATNASGCDRLNLSGALTVVATSGSPFTVKLVSLNAGNTPGLLTNFNKFTNYAWTVATASGGVANFATNKFTLNTSAFANDFTGGSFAVVVAGNNLVVNYTAALLVSPRFTATAAGAAGMQLVATGGVGQAYVLLGATNLAPAVWTPLVTNAAGTNGAVLFADPQATNYSQRFYRLSLP